jgi:hypothetical protein
MRAGKTMLRVHGMLLATMIIGVAVVPAAAAVSHPGGSAQSHPTNTTDRRKGWPYPPSPACGPGCRVVCSGSGPTLKCWWVCPQKK